MNEFIMQNPFIVLLIIAFICSAFVDIVGSINNMDYGLTRAMLIILALYGFFKFVLLLR